MIVSLFGGLGNQLFQYAFGVSTAFARREQLFFTRHRTQNCKYRQPDAYGLDAFVSNIAFTNQETPNVCEEINFQFNPSVYKAPPNSTYIACWQSERYFNTELVRHMMTFRRPMSDQSLRVAEQIASAGPASAFLHVRRADYLVHVETGDDWHGCMSMNYYKEAVRRIQEQHENVLFFVFGDDPNWERENFRGSEFTVIDHVRPDTPEIHEDIQLMSLCRHGAISNSTFAWWGAWFGDTQQNRMVFAPNKWFKTGSLDESNVVPERWVKLGV